MTATLRSFFIERSPWLTVPTIVLVSVGSSVGMLFILVALLHHDYGTLFGRPLLISIIAPIVVSAPVGGYIVHLLREVDLARQYAQDLAWLDALTGLLNRRRMIELGEREFEISRRTGRLVTAALIDLDHFKLINDTHGHRSGDMVIRAVAQAAKGQLRRADLLGRWGGEELLLILPDTDLEAASLVAERIRVAVEELQVESQQGQQIRCTASIGLSLLDRDTSFDGWVDQADRAMYAAKTAGRNRVDAHRRD